MTTINPVPNQPLIGILLTTQEWMKHLNSKLYLSDRSPSALCAYATHILGLTVIGARIGAGCGSAAGGLGTGIGAAVGFGVGVGTANVFTSTHFKK